MLFCFYFFAKVTESDVISIRYANLFHSLYSVTPTFSYADNQYLTHNYLFNVLLFSISPYKTDFLLKKSSYPTV